MFLHVRSFAVQQLKQGIDNAGVRSRNRLCFYKLMSLITIHRHINIYRENILVVRTNTVLINVDLQISAFFNPRKMLAIPSHLLPPTVFEDQDFGLGWGWGGEGGGGEGRPFRAYFLDLRRK